MTCFEVKLRGRLNKDFIISELLKLVSYLEKEFVQLKRENAKLKDENITLMSRIKELESQLNSNNKKSTRPPFSDGYKKQPAFPKKAKGKKRGQSGHKGSTLQQVSNPDEVVKCVPQKCSCGHEFSQTELILSEKRQVFDLPQPQLRVTEYQVHQAKCPVCGKTNKGVVPVDVKAPVQYGHGVKAYITMLNIHYNLPYKKIQLLFKDLFGYVINESTIFLATQKCYANLEMTEQIIKTKISSNEVTHADETDLRIEGKLQWLHTATNNLYTYLFVHPNWGNLALESEKSILDRISGWLVHDSRSSYFGFDNYEHALCKAHIFRELQGLIETGQSKWAKVFKIFLMGVYQMPFPKRVKRKKQIESRFRIICNLGNKIEPLPKQSPGKSGRYKRTKGRNLVEMLMKYQDAVQAFAFNDQIPFTNNLAERDIRPTKIKQKISNSFRSLKGAEYNARIEGFISTARKNKKNIFTNFTLLLKAVILLLNCRLLNNYKNSLLC